MNLQGGTHTHTLAHTQGDEDKGDEGDGKEHDEEAEEDEWHERGGEHQRSYGLTPLRYPHPVSRTIQLTAPVPYY